MIQRLRNPAELDHEDLLYVHFALRRGPFVRPDRHPLEHLERLPGSASRYMSNMSNIPSII